MIEFGWLFSSLPIKKPTEQGSGYLGRIFCHFRALRRAPHGWCIILEKWQCKTNQKNLTGGRYQVTVCLFTIIYNNSEVLQLPPLKLTLFCLNFFMNQARKLWLVPFSCKLFAVPTGLSFYYIMTIFGKMQASKANTAKYLKCKIPKIQWKLHFSLNSFFPIQIFLL